MGTGCGGLHSLPVSDGTVQSAILYRSIDSLFYRALYESLYTPGIWLEINYVLEDNVPMNNAIGKLNVRPLKEIQDISKGNLKGRIGDILSPPHFQDRYFFNNPIPFFISSRPLDSMPYQPRYPESFESLIILAVSSSVG